jgi:hypothetical protein
VCYRGAREVEHLLAGLINDHRDYEKILFEIFEGSDGLTAAEVYEAFTRIRGRPVVNRYLSIEFPHTPPSLQNVIVFTLLQLGFQAQGVRRHMRFYRPMNPPVA